jgi:LmbE family N-acetylglucosaminyl deacetylase
LNLGLSKLAGGRLLCLGAHSDDIEIGCGATILDLVGRYQGLSVDWVVLCSDAEREGEAKSSAASFLDGCEGSEVIVKTFRDGYLPYTAVEVKEFFAQLGAQLNPDLILTHYRGDLHQDHRFVGELTLQTFRNHLTFEYEIPKYDGGLDAPNLYFPVSAAAARKKTDLLIQHFGSQRSKSWFTPETFDGLMRIRGVECKSESGLAEAFHCAKARAA